MISAARRKAAFGLDGFAELLRSLGFPLEMTPVDLALWPEPFRSMPLEVTLACRAGGTDVWFLSGSDADCAAFATAIQKRNHASRAVTVSSGSDANVVLCTSNNGRLRKLEVDLANPSAQVLSRLESLRFPAPDDPTTPAELFDRALDRDALGRRFFRKFRGAVELIAAVLERESGQSARICSDQSLLILSRILFLYFVQQKGWLDGDRRFLLRQLRSAVSESASFYRTRLRPLFFDCLNTPASSRSAESRRLGRIPYLNGGLFEPTSFDLRFEDIDVPNDVMAPVIEEVFESFAFSISEDAQSAVHIDPEMLGKVFESLMESEERAASGTFYTPRELVEALVNRSLAEWCSDETGDLDLLTRVLKGEAIPLPDSLATRVKAKLENVTVIDIACGSGAFLLAAVRGIEVLLAACGAPKVLADGRMLRQRIVEESIYGVDISSHAVRLCELRLWLAIISDSHHTIDSVPPLPNLDRNILQGNSLLGPIDFLGGGRMDVYAEWSYAIRARTALAGAYRHATRAERARITRALRKSDLEIARQLLRRSLAEDSSELSLLRDPERTLFEGAPQRLATGRINELEARMEETRSMIASVNRDELGFFSFAVHFAHVLAGGGFDLVVGNPPWVRGSRIPKATRRQLQDRYLFFGNHAGEKGRPGFDQTELALTFLEKGVNLTRREGIVAQLLPSKIATADYASAMRAGLARQGSFVAVFDWSDQARELFDADVFPLGVVFAKSEERRDVEVHGAASMYRLPQLSRIGDVSGKPWRIAPPSIVRIAQEISSRFGPLSESLGRRPLMGVKTGANRNFFIEEIEPAEEGVRVLPWDVVIPAERVVRCVRGRDISHWSVTASTWMLWPPAAEWPDEPWVRKLERRIGVEISKLTLAYVRPEHLGMKVVWKDVSKGLKAVVSPATVMACGREFALVPNQTTYCLDVVSLDEAYLVTAYLNSAVFNALTLLVAERAKDAHFRYFGSTVGSVPLPHLDVGTAEGRALIRMARRAHVDRKPSPDLDDMIAKSYGISSPDLEALRDWVGERLAL